MDLSLIALQGNSTHPDPLRRLFEAAPSTSHFRLSHSVLTPFTSLSFDWASLFDSLPSLRHFDIVTTQLGANSVSLPEQIPRLDSFCLINCGVVGTIPRSLLASYNDSSEYHSFFLDLSNNALIGTIPDQLFSTLNWTSITSFSVSVVSNMLTGPLPTLFFDDASSYVLSNVHLDFSNNPGLNGLFPSAILSSLPYVASSASYSFNPHVVVHLDRTNIQGILSVPNLGSSGSFAPQLTISASESNITWLSIADGAEKSLVNLNVSYNRQLSGTLPASIFGSSSSLSSLDASYTSLTGVMPNMGELPAPNLVQLALVGISQIDFCSGSNRTAWTSSSLTSCQMESTNAFNCTELYPSVCTTSKPSSVITPMPTFPCSEATRPTSLFDCINSTWTFNGNLNTTVLTLPAGSDSIINGNLTSYSIIFVGLRSSLTLQGCPNNLSSVSIVLRPGELKHVRSGSTANLVSFSSSDPLCSLRLRLVQITPQILGDSCRKVSIRSQLTDGQFSAILKTDSSSCGVWWVILVSVVSAVALIAVVVVIVSVGWFRTPKNTGDVELSDSHDGIDD